MLFDKLLTNISNYRLIYAGILTELIALGAGVTLGRGELWYVLSGIVLLILYIIFTFKNKTSLNKEALMVKTYKDQTKMLFEALNSLLEYAEDPDLAQGLYKRAIDQSILHILEQLHFLHNPSIRVSLYSHSDKGFVLLYRHADDPEFEKKGRAIYPDDEGIIGAAYHKNMGFVDNLPDPNEAEAEWIKAQLSPEIGLMKNENAVKNLTMKSRNLFALPIRSGHDKHMVIVFESLTPKQLNRKTIEKLINSHYGIKLKEDLSMYREYIEPSLEYAQKMRM